MINLVHACDLKAFDFALYIKTALGMVKAQNSFSVSEKSRAENCAVSLFGRELIVNMAKCLKFKAFADRLLVKWVNVAVFAAVESNRNARVRNCLMHTHLRLTDKTPVLSVLFAAVDMHRELNENERKSIIVPVVSPLFDKHFQQLAVHIRLVIVAFALIIDEACESVWADTL